MTNEEIKTLLAAVIAQIEAQGRIVDNRLMQKKNDLEKLLSLPD